MNGQRAIAIATGGLLLLALIGLGWALTRATPDEPSVEAPEPAPLRVRPAPKAVPEDGPMARRTLPAPAGVPRPEVAPPDGPPADLSTEQWRDYNEAVHQLVLVARRECVRPWVHEQGLGRIEIVLDAVLWDGEVVDFGIRGLQDVPDHVLDCVADHAWNASFPRYDIPGELRLQRAVKVDGR